MVEDLRSGRRKINANFAAHVLLTAAIIHVTTLPACAVVKQWVAGSGNWSNAANWSPVGVPGPLDSALIGNLPSVENETILLNQPDEIAGLIVANGMTLDTNNFLLEVNGTAWITGQNNVEDEVYPSTLRIDPLASFADFYAVNMLVNNGGRFELVGGAAALVSETATIGAGGTLIGNGILQSNSSDVTLVNDGLIVARTGGLAIYQPNDGLLDLDGTSEGGAVRVDTRDGTEFLAWGPALTDAFSGDIEVYPSSAIRLQFDDGWTADAASTIRGVSVPWIGPAPPARVLGSEVTLAGSVVVDAGNSYLRFEAPAEVLATFSATVGAGGRLEFSGDTVMRGGNITLSDGARLDFYDDTTWAGTVTINGFAQQNANAVVAQPTVINANVFNWSGYANHVDWTVNSTLVINADSVRADADDAFGGVLDVSGSATSRITLNLAEGESWRMAGDLYLGGLSPGFVTRIAGSPMAVTGTVNIENSNVDVTADVEFLPTATISFDFPGSDLRLRGVTTIHDETEFTGQGLLHNGVGGRMRLLHGATTDEVGLVNHGVLEIGAGNSTGSASVDRFTNEEDGTLVLKIGGNVPVAQYDRLLVTGDESPELAGTLELHLVGSGGGLFVPDSEDFFLVLVATENLLGGFDAIPATSVGGLTVAWELSDAVAHQLVVRIAELSGVVGDYNYNGVVDAADYTVWRDTFGQHGPGLAADGDGSGAIDEGDYAVWKANFGMTGGGSVDVSAVIPEPQTSLLFGFGSVAFSIWRRRLV